MNIKERIRAEIERRMETCDANSKTPDQLLWAELSALLPFLDALEDSECPEYCVRSHCIGCSKYNPDEWYNKPRKAKIKATGEIVEGFTDGQGHFDVFTDHNVCSRYDVSAVEFDALSEEPDKDLKEAAEEYSDKYCSDWAYRLEYEDAFIAGAKWQAEKCDEETSKLLYGERQTAYIYGWHDCKEQMMKEAVEADVNTYRNLEEGTSWAEFVVEMPTNNLGDKVRIIIVKEDGE